MKSTGSQILFAGNAAIVELRGLTNSMTGEPIDSATVECTLLDADGEEVDPGEATWPLDMAYLPDSNGVYQAVLAADIDIVPGARYTLHVTADAGAGLAGRWDLPCICMTRT